MVKPRLVLCAVAAALGLVFVSTGSPQYLEATIMLPDTLGPMNGPYHLAWDENPAHPRLYIGGEGDSGGVIVAEAITCKRLARVSTGPVKALCFVPSHGKLYVAKAGIDSVAVVDCATNLVVSAVHTAGGVLVMQYNAVNDRLYCGGDSMAVVDCTGDTVMRTIAIAASAFAYDSASNKLYAGSSGPLVVIDCASDSVVAAIPEVDSAMGLCFNPTAGKVYATSGETLYAIQTGGDSLVARLPFSGLVSVLTCDPQRNRIYCAYSGRWASIDCAGDTVILACGTAVTPRFMACNILRDMLYVFRELVDAASIFDATTGQLVKNVRTDGQPPGGGWSPNLDRLYCLPQTMTDPALSCCLLSAVSGAGDSIAGIVPLTMVAENIVLDTVHNRLYFMYDSASACGCVGVVDCAQNIVTSYTYVGKYAKAMCYNPSNDRLYWRTSNYIAVYDCSTNTVVGKVETNSEVRAARLHLGLNKLYAYARDTLGAFVLDVVDCDYDSLVRVIPLPGDGLKMLLLVPEDNTLWYLGVRYVTVVDCVGDSVIAEAADSLGSIDDACACPEDRRIYAGWGGRPAWIVDMDDPAQVDTLHPWIPDSREMRFLSMPETHKAYWSVNWPSHPPGTSHLFVIDTRNSTLVDSLWVSRKIAGMCLDHTGNFVYCAAYEDTVVLVVDARADSVVAMIEVPILPAAKNPLAVNRATNRIYVAQYSDYVYGNGIPVIRDSMLIGLEESGPSSPSRRVGQTVVSRGTPMRVLATSELWDATGRRAAVLKNGQNDISHLAPGVYFVREAQAYAQAQAVRKVILTE